MLGFSLGPDNNRYQYGYWLLFIGLSGYRYLIRTDDYQCSLVGIKILELYLVVGYFLWGARKNRCWYGFGGLFCLSGEQTDTHTGTCYYLFQGKNPTKFQDLVLSDQYQKFQKSNSVVSDNTRISFFICFTEAF